MDRTQVDNVAGLPPSRRGHGLVGREIDRVQDITENLVAHRREEPEVAVQHPFEFRAFGAAGPDGLEKRRLAPLPFDGQAAGLENRSVLGPRARDAFFTIMENVDIARQTGGIANQPGAAGHMGDAQS